MWEICIDEELLKEFCPEGKYGLPVTLTVRAAAIRDGTPGLSVAIGGGVVGEWTDSRVKSVGLARGYKITVYGRRGDALYQVVASGKAIDGRQLSDTEVAISVQL